MVLSSNMVLQKGLAASQHLCQTRIAECLVGDETGHYPLQSSLLVMIKKLLRETIQPITFPLGVVVDWETSRPESATLNRCSLMMISSNHFAVDLLKPDATVIFCNAEIDMFKGSKSLAVDKCCIEVSDPANFVIKEDNNLSLVEYELVSVVEE